MTHVAHRTGATLLLSVLIIGSTIFTVSMGLAMRNIDELSMGFSHSQSLRARALLDGCAEEGLLQISRSSQYTGNTIEIDGGTCTITVTDDSPNKQMVVEATQGRWTQTLTSTIQFSGGMSVLNWTYGP